MLVKKILVLHHALKIDETCEIKYLHLRLKIQERQLNKDMQT
jgi:hypothetical protein